jgi:hypothetical protein
MLIERVKRWQWLLLGVAVGTLLWWSWRPDPGSLAGYGECMNDSRAFEAALVGAARGAPRFSNVRVHRQSVDDGAGSAAEVYVVSGDYCDGNADPLDGTLHWRPRYFLAPAPYRPHWNLYDFGDAKGEAAKALEQYQRIESPTVVDFLRLLRTAGVLSYTHAWWRTYPAATWVGGSVVLIGVVWPTVINLLVFGRLTRPREEKGIDLSKVKNPPTPAPAGPSADDLEQLHELEAELEARLAGVTPEPPTEQPPAPPRRAAALVTSPADPAPGDGPHDDTVFGAKPDDFYPTERHADHPQHPPPPARR